MIKFVLEIILISSIFCNIQFNGNFTSYYLLNAYITPNNNLLLSNTYHYRLFQANFKNNSMRYNTPVEINPGKFNAKSNYSDEIYFDISYFNESLIQVFFFNEKNASYSYYSPRVNYSHFSIEEVGPNKLVFFLNSNTSVFHLVYFNATAENDNRVTNLEQYSLKKDNIRTNSYCTLTSSNMLVCGLITIRKDTVLPFKCITEYEIVLLRNNSVESKITVFSESFYNFKDDFGKGDSNGVFRDSYFKMIPLNDDKVFYCYNQKTKNKCGLIQIVNDTIKCLTVEKNILEIKSNYYYKNVFSALKYNDDQIILSSIEGNYLNVAKVTIMKNNSFITKTSFKSFYDLGLGYSGSSFYYLKILKNKQDDLIAVLGSSSYVYIQELSIPYCKDYTNTIFNGVKTSLKLENYPGIFKKDSIVFFNNGKEINSLINSKGTKIKEKEVYNSMEVSFQLDSKDFDEINKNKEYSLEFSNSLNASEAQRCKLTLTFHECHSDCEICTSSSTSETCYDRYWKTVYIKTNFEKFFFIIPAAILAMLLVLIFFSFAKCCCMKENMPNYGENAVINEMPLIS